MMDLFADRLKPDCMALDSRFLRLQKCLGIHMSGMREVSISAAREASEDFLASKIWTLRLLVETQNWLSGMQVHLCGLCS